MFYPGQAHHHCGAFIEKKHASVHYNRFYNDDDDDDDDDGDDDHDDDDDAVSGLKCIQSQRHADSASV